MGYEPEMYQDETTHRSVWWQVKRPRTNSADATFLKVTSALLSHLVDEFKMIRSASDTVRLKVIVNGVKHGITVQVVVPDDNSIFEVLITLERFY